MAVFLSGNSYGDNVTQKMFGANGYNQVFYSINQFNEIVPNNSPVKIGSGEIYEILVDVARKPKNFIGFVDSDNVTIQFMVDEFDKIWMEVPSAKDKGSFGKYINNEEMLNLINNLSEPYFKYINELNLKLVKW